jgi:hypothetical protein
MRMLDVFKTVCLVLAMAGLTLGCEEKKDEESDTEEADDGLTDRMAGGGGGSGGDGDNDDDGAEGGEEEGGEAAGEDDGEDDGDDAPVDFSIVGTWLNEKCSGDDKSRQTFVYGDDDSLNVTMAMFGSDGCADQMMEMSLVASYSLGDLMADNPARKPIDIEIVSGTLTLKDQGMVDDMNADDSEFCANDDPWVLDQPVSLADLDCGEGFPTPGMQIFELIGVDGEYMSMGDSEDGEKDGSSEDKRPMALNADAAELFSKVVD